MESRYTDNNQKWHYADWHVSPSVVQTINQRLTIHVDLAGEEGGRVGWMTWTKEDSSAIAKNSLTSFNIKDGTSDVLDEVKEPTA